MIIDKIETKQNEQGNVESVEIFDEFIKYRKILEDKNKRIYTSSNYISSESPKISEN